MGTGENSGQWGDVTNINLGTALEEAICESADVSFSGDSQVLTLSDVNTTQVARHLRLNLTGTGSAGITLTVPDIEKNYIINNGLSVDVGIKNSSGSQVTIPDGRSAIVYSTGSGVVDAITSLNTAEITQLTVASTTTFSGGVSAASVVNIGDNLSVKGNASVGGTFTLTGTGFLDGGIAEGAKVVASTAGSTINLNLDEGGILYYTGTADTNFAFNIRGNASTTLNSVMSTADSVGVALIMPQDSTARQQTSLQIDGTTASGLYWQGGATAEATGNGIEVFAVNIIKTGDADYTVFSLLQLPVVVLCL